MIFKPVRASSIPEGIYDELVSAIVSGRFHPGERLTLEAIAAQFEVSVMPVREAFRKLEATKLVRRERNRSILVSALSVDNIREILEIRLLLEPHAAGHAAVRRNDDTLELMKSLHNRMLKTTDTETYLQINRDFHFAIYEAARLPILLELIGALWERYSPYLYILHRTEKRWPIEMVMRNHQGMLDAIQGKNRERVQTWLSKDLTESAERIIKMIQKRGSE